MYMVYKLFCSAADDFVRAHEDSSGNVRLNRHLLSWSVMFMIYNKNKKNNRKHWIDSKPLSGEETKRFPKS